MIAYRKERIENAMLYFAQEHYKKTHNYLSQTALYKYLAFFEFRRLDNYGEMPLALEYKARQFGPVPEEIYAERDRNPFSLIKFEPRQAMNGITIYLVKPNGKFNADYFSENELTEMKNLIEIFAQKWVGSGVMSDASHESIRAWKITYKKTPNGIIDPICNFKRNVANLETDELTQAEERFLTHRKIGEQAH